MNETVERGDEVVCQITGLRGTATTESINLQGVRRVSVVPGLGPDGKMQDSWDIDVINLKILTKNKVKAQPPVQYDLKLGDEAEDTVSGFKGVIISESTCLNGCKVAVLQPKINYKGELPKARGFDFGRLRAIKKAVIQEGQRQTGAAMEKARIW